MYERPIALKHLAQDGAVEGQAVTWNSGTGEWEPAAVGLRIAQPGVITDNLRFHVDFNNQSSWAPNQTATWTDTIASVAGTTAGVVTITDGHLEFSPTLTTEVDFGTLPTALENIYAGSGTVSAWVYIQSDQLGGLNDGKIISTQNPAGDIGWGVRVLEEDTALNTVRIGFEVGANASLNRWKITTAVSIREWVMISVTFDSDAVMVAPTIYINGRVVTVEAIGGASNTPYTPDIGQPLTVGNRAPAGTEEFWGFIETVSLYDTGKTAAELLEIWTTTAQRFEPIGLVHQGFFTDKLIFHLDFNNQDSFRPNQANSTSGVVDTPTWLDTIYGKPGTVNGAVVEDGHLNFFSKDPTSSWVDLGLVDRTAQFWRGGGTIACWIRPESDGEGSLSRFFKTGNTEIRFRDEVAGFMKIQVIGTMDSVDANVTTNDAVLPTGEWVFLTISWDGTGAGTIIIKINGVEAAHPANGGSNALVDDFGTAFLLCNTTSFDRAYDGDLEVFCIYDKVLSATEITDMYEMGIARFDIAAAPGSPQPGIITQDAQFHIDFNNTNSWVANQLTAWTDLIGGAAGTAADTTITDGHLNFNGVDSNVDFGAPKAGMLNPFLGGGSFNVWIRIEAATSVAIVLTTGSTDGFDIRVQEEAGGLYRAVFVQKLSASNKQYKSPVVIKIGEWANVGFSWDGDVTDATGADGQMYVNGVAVTTTLGGVVVGTIDAGTGVVVGFTASSADGDIEMITVFDVEQPASVHLDIYNATKDRFGIFATPLAFTIGAAKAGAYAALAFERVRVVIGATLTLPATPATDTLIGSIDATAAALPTVGTYTVTAGGGDLIQDPTTNSFIAVATCNLAFASYVWQYDAVSARWRLVQ